MAHHEIPFVPETMIRGILDAKIPPVLRVASGDTVALSALPAGGLDSLPKDGRAIPDIWRRGVEAFPEPHGGHFISGPVYVEGARIGDTLEVEILEARPWMEWGFTAIMPLLGAAPEVFTDYETIHPTVDLAASMVELPWGTRLPLEPFFGIIAVAPPLAWGACSSVQPRAFGGNMDNKELKPGTTLYLPIFNDGALFMAGDGHGVQGDGEVCISALEIGLTGTFRLTVRRDLHLKRPFAETATHLISIGLDEDLDDAAKQAVLEMVDHVCARTNLSPNQAYMLCSLAGDLRVTQIVDMVKGAHMMLAKDKL
jgi:acetamidase/formamidase